jgi:hypothetical protein
MMSPASKLGIHHAAFRPVTGRETIITMSPKPLLLIALRQTLVRNIARPGRDICGQN